MPAKLKGLRRATRLRHGHREIKMLAPMCVVCQGGENVPDDWHVRCPHEPYIGTRSETIEVRKYEDEKGPDGKPTGNRIVVGTESTTVERPWPNFREIALTERINSGRGVEMARAKGFILPSELVCDAFPDGIADCCQFQGCFWQDDLKTYPGGGVYCRDIEAAYIYEDERGATIEVYNSEIRTTQVDEALARVR